MVGIKKDLELVLTKGDIIIVNAKIIIIKVFLEVMQFVDTISAEER